MLIECYQAFALWIFKYISSSTITIGDDDRLKWYCLLFVWKLEGIHHRIDRFIFLIVNVWNTNFFHFGHLWWFWWSSLLSDWGIDFCHIFFITVWKPFLLFRHFDLHIFIHFIITSNTFDLFRVFWFDLHLIADIFHLLVNWLSIVFCHCIIIIDDWFIAQICVCSFKLIAVFVL